ncbi:class I mannose-6-phosphate isomerase [Clostridium perfringens]|uniref:class I mannose-6-phosphate isomerase n=1 Tax=Clostridium perfringens TaxID=1502 RepID=UPI0024BC33A5|nr:class I mannose-6-phosphate isomerase [Clostridium perfringens]MDM0459355.1 class I mannose-6-phosphate isomerase [Clostridium perfringens]
MFNKYNNYDKYPTNKIKGFNEEAWQGYDSIIEKIQNNINNLNKINPVLVIDCYIGVDLLEIKEAFSKLNPIKMIKSDDFSLNSNEINEKIKNFITEDRVFGVMNNKKLSEFFPEEKLKEARNIISNHTAGLIIIYGTGASLITQGDILIFSDLARWEIQMRYRNGMGNWKANNENEQILKKYKRGFFLEWRMMDKHKKSLFSKIDYILDTNIQNNPKMITSKAFFNGLNQILSKPFRVVPYFDPGVWGGQWMKEVFDLDKTSENYAWSFDGVPEENSLYLQFGEIKIEIPAINLVLINPQKLLGEKVHARFGCEFPIRFDFLDTMGGQNLSLQVHPLTEYIQENFGMHYTQDESYYILDCEEDAYVYLGLKEDINKNHMIRDLKLSEKGEILFPTDKYINKFPAKKHDHFLIPAGTVHCSGSGTMVLEISATPYIFTFKLWDWGRLGLDGLPRPIHLDHGEKNIQWDRTTSWVKENLINDISIIYKTHNIKEEKTGLHEREFIETRRHRFSESVIHSTNQSVNVLNLVEGAEAIVESPTNSFDPFIVHYAETFIIPECVKEYTITPYGKSVGKELVTIKAYVR